MTTIRVTVEMTVTGLPDEDARKHARALVEARGLNIVSSTIKRNPDGGRDFTPQPGAPGRLLTRNGRQWQVWAQAPTHLGYKGKGIWVVPVDRRPDDAPVYLADAEHPEYAPAPYTALGKPIRKPKREAPAVAAA